MFRRVQTLVALLLGIVASPVCAGEAEEIADRCLAAILRIRSYDVLLEVDRFSGSSEQRLSQPLSVETSEKLCRVHDVMSLRSGRRFELWSAEEVLQSIAVKDWDNEVAGAEFLADAVTGMDFPFQYSSYYDPAFYTLREKNGFPQARVLHDLLQDKATTLERTDPQTAGKLLGIRVQHRNLMGYLQVWVDPEHGDLPARVEHYGRYYSTSGSSGVANGEVLLDTVIRVEQFSKVADGTWVPLAGAYLDMNVADSKKIGLVRDGYVAVVDAANSSWNAVSGGDLFLAASLPAVNREENGWKQYFAPEPLANVSRYDEAMKELWGSVNTSIVRVSFVLANILLILIIAWLLVVRKRQHASGGQR